MTNRYTTKFLTIDLVIDYLLIIAITHRLLIDVFYHRLVTSGTWSVFGCNVACERNCIYDRRLWWRASDGLKHICISRLLTYNALEVLSVWFGSFTFIRSKDVGKFTPF